MKVAIFIPQKDFTDESLNLMTLILSKCGVQYKIASYGKGGMGAHGALVRSDIRPEQIPAEQYDGIVLIDGKGVDEQKLYDYRPLLEIVSGLNDEGKYIVAVGNAVKIPCRANIVKGKKVTVTDQDTMSLARLFYGIPSPNQVEGMGNLITIKNSKAIEGSIDDWLRFMNLV